MTQQPNRLDRHEALLIRLEALVEPGLAAAIELPL